MPIPTLFVTTTGRVLRTDAPPTMLEPMLRARFSAAATGSDSSGTVQPVDGGGPLTDADSNILDIAFLEDGALACAWASRMAVC